MYPINPINQVNATANRNSAYWARFGTRPQLSGATSRAPRYITESSVILTTMMINVVMTCGIEAATLYTVLVK